MTGKPSVLRHQNSTTIRVSGPLVSSRCIDPASLFSECVVGDVQSINDRFFVFEEIETDAVLSLDEDAQLLTDEVGHSLNYY